MSGENERNGAGDSSFHSRLADLLDDVTVGAPALQPAQEIAPLSAPPSPQSPTQPSKPASSAASIAESTPQSTPGSTPAAVPPSTPPQSPSAPERSAPAGVQPVPGAPADDSLPPFLAKAASTSESKGIAPDGARPATETKQEDAPPSQPAPGTSPGIALFTAGLPAGRSPSPPPAPSVTPGAAHQSPPGSGPGPLIRAVALVTGNAVTAGAPSASDAPEAMRGVPDSSRATPALQSISIKGRADGLAVEIGVGTWPELMLALKDRLQHSAGFFRNAQVALDVGARSVTEIELGQLVELLATNAMTLGAVRTSAERTFQSALALGLTATLESAEGLPVADAAPAATNAATGAYFVYRGYLRSGHRLKRKESILVIGDVNPGAEVISDGDVLVWGRLRGVVHAGAHGNQRAIVAALDLEPTQLRIAEHVAIGPDPKPGQPGKWFWQRSANKRPEVARVVNQTLVLEEWDATRPGGFVSLRRGG